MPELISFSRKFLMVFLVLTAPSLLAWGPTGHRVVGQIATMHLTPQTAAALQDLIGPASLADVSNWADWIRSDPAYDFTSSWHYVNLPDGVSYAEAEPLPEGDAYAKILDFIKVLKDDAASKADKALAIKWLTHLIGDIHQPLHAGHLDDLGGNRIRCVWFGEPCNLHQIWDSKIIDATHLSYTELADKINRNTAVKIEAGPEPEPDQWLEESLKYRATAYQAPEASTGGTYRYIFEHSDLVEQRLTQAGRRLALTLNYALGAE